jgi:glutathione S-transferase
MLQILGRASSLNVRKVLWLCEELGLAFEREDWGAGFRSAQSPEFLALNPNGLVPVIRDGNFVLWESNTICRYLATKHRRADLLPVEAEPRARVEQWMDWQATELNSAWVYAFMALVRKSASHRDEAQIHASVAAWSQQMGILEAQLSRTSGFVVGDNFTLADVVVGLSVHRWFMTPIERPDLPCVARYYDELGKRLGFQAHGRNGIP